MTVAFDERVLDEVAAAWATVPGGLLPALQGIQERLGWVPAEAVPVLAEAFNVSRAEVHGVLTFYADFRRTPAQGTCVEVCGGEACQARGGRAVGAAAERLAAGGAPIEVREVFCFGNCALGPSVRVGGRLHARVDDRLLAEFVAGGEVGQAAEAGAARSRSVVGQGVDPGPDTVTVYVPADSAARAVGADEVAERLAASGAHVVRTGSRGMLWLEPLVEVATATGRIAYGPVGAADVDGLLAAGMLHGADHPRRVGAPEEHPWLAAQDRFTTARLGVVDPSSFDDYVAHGGLAGLRRALSMTPAEVVAEITASGLRGRGGAAFPAGVKWQAVADAPGEVKYVCANADEGDSGTFVDRMLIEGDPFSLLEAMVIAGYAVGAGEGYAYVRSEYPDALRTLRAAVEIAVANGLLTDQPGDAADGGVLGSGFRFRVHVRSGAGAYICGEETAMLESLEGRRGVVRAKPPLPSQSGLFGKPTLVNNVLTLATVPAILAHGAAAYAARGSGRSRGTQVFQLGGDVATGGLVELPFGITLRDLLGRFAGGPAGGRRWRAVQVGGPLGAYLPMSALDVACDYEALAAAGAMLGHGGIVVFDDTVDMAAQARFAMEFCAAESCGKCTPCRIGSTRGTELLDQIAATAAADGEPTVEQRELLDDLCEVMAGASLCALGGLTPTAVRSALTHFPEDFRRGGRR